jgi:Rrf2 family protein
MLALTTKGRYASRIMVYLAGRDNSTPATKQEIGDHEGISPDYVEQIMMGLKMAQLVQSHRGRRGGFSLLRPPHAIRLSEVLRAVEGPVCMAPCIQQDCARLEQCPTYPVWRRAAQALEDVFENTLISDMVNQAPPEEETGR